MSPSSELHEPSVQAQAHGIEFLNRDNSILAFNERVLDLASGEIRDVKYVDFDMEAEGFPAESEDYDFTCGTLSNGSKDVEFRIEVDVVGRKYSITPSELLELKGRAAKLFSAPPGGPPPPEPPRRGRR